jgi:hypothetical protein
MKKLHYFDKIITGGIMLLIAFLFCALAGCSKDDEPGNGNDNNGAPYKFKIEISTEKPDEFKLYLRDFYYTLLDENGKQRVTTINKVEDFLKFWDSPLIREVEVPSRNFDGLAMSYGLAGDDSAGNMVNIKIFVNGKLLISYSEKQSVILFLYKSGNKYYIDSNYRAKYFEFDKLD